MTSNGYNVMGWGVDESTGDIKQDTVKALRIMSAENMTYEPEATTKATVTGILDKNDTSLTSTSGKIMNLMFYDKLGYAYTAKFNIKSTDNDGEYTVEIASILDSENNEIAGVDSLNSTSIMVNRTTPLSLQAGYVWSDQSKPELTLPDGTTKIDLSTLADGDAAWEDVAKAYGFSDVNQFLSLEFQIDMGGGVTTIGMKDYLKNISVNYRDASGNTATENARKLVNPDGSENLDVEGVEAQRIAISGAKMLYYSTATGKFNGIGATGVQNSSIVLALSTLDPNFEDISVDFSTTTMFNNSGVSTMTAASGDHEKLGAGRKLGNMSGITIQQDGRIYASYDNGMSRLLGQIAAATFANASGLMKEGDNLYAASQNSGEFDGIGVEVTTGGGYMTTGVLEMSNVDLSAEFTEMITTQRGFQANSRIITVSDTLLEELVNLKR